MDGSQIHPDNKARYAKLKIIDCINQAQIKCKGAELSYKSMGKSLHELFKAVVDQLNNSFPTLEESGSNVSRFIP